jgi:glutamate racemase
VFDSGIGGLTVARELARVWPAEDIVYLGDVARFPYGTKSAETITRFALEDAEFLVRRGVSVVVAACHSASSVALPELVRRIDRPVVGVVEAGARALAGATLRQRVGVIGTEATIRAGAYEAAVHRFGPGIEVVGRATPLLVALAEEGWIDGPVAEAVCRRYLADMVDEGIDALLLGCTHFPLLAPVIRRVVGPGVQVVDSAAATAEAVGQLLGAPCGVRGERKGRLRVYLTDLSPGFEAVGSRFLGSPIGDVARVSLGQKENPDET